MRSTRPGRPALRLWAVLVVLLLTGGGAACSGDEPEAPPKPPAAGSVLEWNLSGWSQHRGSAVPVDALVRQLQATSPPPVAVALVELCSNQYDLLRDRLAGAPWNYRSASAWSIPDFGQPSCASFGNAVFWQGEAEPDGEQVRTFPADAQADGARTQEKRTLVCAAFRIPETTTTAASPIRVCATHLHRLPAVAERQLAVVRSTIDQHNGTGPPTVLAGDLNLSPTDPALAAWYSGGYVEADRTEPAGARPTTRTMRKLDYVFAPSASVRVTRSADIVPVPESDHAVYTAHVALNG
jgi:endonuclease/exonuclease/phosphatase family metal-dependent hydrolase